MYKTIKFEIRDIEEVQSDIKLAEQLYGSRVRTVFIGDSNSLTVKAEKLVEILHSLYASFPRIERVTSYARAKTLARKPVEDLERIRQAGLTRLHVGLETGDRDLLKEIEKGATPEEMVEAGERAKRAGFEYSVYVLLGIGGEGGWERHASATAKVLNQIDPHFIRVRTFVPLPGSLLYEAMTEGRFQSPSPETILKETRLLLEGLRGGAQFLSDHVSNLLPLHGKLPDEREKMMHQIDDALEKLKGDPRLKEEMALRRQMTNL